LETVKIEKKKEYFETEKKDITKLNNILEKYGNNPIFERVLKEHKLTKDNFVQNIIESPELE